MKRIVIILTVLIISVLFLGNTVTGQVRVRKGLKFGYNWSTLSGDGFTGVESIKSFAGGVNLDFTILGILSFEVAAIYSPRGVLSANQGEIQLNYLSIPIVLKKRLFPLGIHPYFMGGAEFNFLLSYKTDAAFLGPDDAFASQEFGLIGGGGIELNLVKVRIYIEGRYSYGLDNIYKDEADGLSKNRVSQVFVGMMF
jgi:hypothetical protein